MFLEIPKDIARAPEERNVIRFQHRSHHINKLCGNHYSTTHGSRRCSPNPSMNREGFVRMRPLSRS